MSVVDCHRLQKLEKAFLLYFKPYSMVSVMKYLAWLLNLQQLAGESYAAAVRTVCITNSIPGRNAQLTMILEKHRNIINVSCQNPAGNVHMCTWNCFQLQRKCAISEWNDNCFLARRLEQAGKQGKQLPLC